MRTTLPLLLAAALAAHPATARADADLGPALEFVRAGKHAEAVALLNARWQQLPPATHLTRWTVPFEGRPVPVALIGQKHVVITSHASRHAKTDTPAGDPAGPLLDDRTGQYDFGTMITGFDAATGKRLWTRRAPGHVDLAIDDRSDTIYAWREKLFKLNPDTGETDKTIDLPARPKRVEALVVNGRPVVPRPRHTMPDDHRAAPIHSYDVDEGKAADRDLLLPLRLSPDEKRVLVVNTGNVPGGYGTGIAVRPFNGDKPDWTYTHPSASYNEPLWFDGDVVALIGDETSRAEVVRLGGADGKVKWRFELPRGAYAPGRDQLPGGAYPGRTWTAVGPCGDYLLAIGGEGSLYVLDPKTGKLVSKASPATTYLTFPRLVDGALVVCSFEGVRAIPWDVVLRRHKADEGDLIVLRTRCLHALGKTVEALESLNELLVQDPERADAWALKADLCRAAKHEGDEVAARCRHLELTGRDSSPDLRERWGLLKRVASGNDLRADLKAAGEVVYAGTSAGWVLKIDTRSLAVERTEVPGTVGRLSGSEAVKAHFYSGPPRDLGGRSDDDPPAPVKGPGDWNTVSGLDGPVVRWNGKHYRPLGGGAVRELDGETVREHKCKLEGIRQWQIHVSPWGAVGFGTGGVYGLDENLCPARALVKLPEGREVQLLAGDAKTLGVVTHGRKTAVLQVWTRDGSRMLREQEVVPTGPLGRGAEHLLPVAGGYLLSAGDVAWVPAAADGAAWRFGFGEKPGRALPKIHYAHASLFTTPLVRDNLLFVGCRDGAVYVFDLNAVTRR